MRNFRSFTDLGVALDRPVEQRAGRYQGKNMSNNGSSNSSFHDYNAVTKFYNHDKRFGILYVTVPKGEKIRFDLKTSVKDSDPETNFSEGEVLDRDIIVESFIHGSVLVKAGYEEGLEENESLVVKISNNEKGPQVISTKNKPGYVPAHLNERRPSNEFLKFVKGTVKSHYEERNFGFISVESDPKTGEPLDTPRDVYFARDMYRRAFYRTLKEGQEVTLRYWTYSNGKSNVVQFKYPDHNTDQDTVMSAEEKEESRREMRDRRN